MALLPNMYRPIVSPENFGVLGPMGGLYGGGPERVELPMTPVAAPAVAPAPTIEQRREQAEALLRAQQQQPSIRPSAPPIAQAPGGLGIGAAAPAPTVTPAPTVANAPIQFMSADEFYGLVDENTRLGFPELFRGMAGPDQTLVASAPQYDPSAEGLAFMNNRGVIDNFVRADPNTQYRLVDRTGGGIVAEGTGLDALRSIYSQSRGLSAAGGKDANWQVETFNPRTGQWEIAAKDRPDASPIGMFADIALPVLGATLLPGVGGALGGALGAGLGAAGGSALSSIAQGRSLEDTLLRAAISGVGSGGLSAVTGAPFIPASAPASGAGALAGSTLGAGTMGLTGAKMAGLLPEIVVSGTGGALGAGLGAGLGGGLSSALPSTAAPRDVTTGGIDVVANRVPTGGALPVATAGAGAMGQAGLNLLPDSVRQQIEQQAEQARAEQERELVVTGARESALPDVVDAGTLAGALAGAGAAAAPSTPKDVQDAFDEEFGQKNSLLDEIIKYYSLVSAGLDLAGGALGGGRGGQTTPYVSQLGPMPTFSRGAFTPFTGDYETYGFGPEFNFFEGQSAPVPAPPLRPTGPLLALLPPAALPGSGIV